MASEYPSCLHTVSTSIELKPHTVPHCPLQYTSTRPSLVKLPPVSRTIPLYGLLQRREVTAMEKQYTKCMIVLQCSRPLTHSRWLRHHHVHWHSLKGWMCWRSTAESPGTHWKSTSHRPVWWGRSWSQNCIEKTKIIIIQVHFPVIYFFFQSCQPFSKSQFFNEVWGESSHLLIIFIH